ncbi:MAG: hypothetical protein JW982_09960 [Spirochaetes bacterium]|nr:hypothetical protein [Spirochaetota bacterium]
MKKSVLITLFCIITLSSCGKEWVAKIEGKSPSKIYIDEFNSLYYAQHRMSYGEEKTNEEIDKLAENLNYIQRNPLLDKKKFLDQLIQIELVVNKAKNDNFIENDEELQSYIDTYTQGAVVNFYAQKKFKDKLVVSDEEIAKEYETNMEMFKNADMDKVENYIKQQLLQKKFVSLGNELIEELKTGSTIEKNADVIKKIKNDETTEDKDWVVKIDGKELKAKDYITLYYSQLKTLYNTDKEHIDTLRKTPEAVEKNPLLSHDGFIEQYIRQDLMYKKAVDDKVFETNPDLKSLITLQEKNLIMSYYLKDKLGKETEVTEDEITGFYQQNADKFANVPADQAENYIRQQISQQKLQRAMSNFITALKEESKIEKKPELFTKTEEQK